MDYDYVYKLLLIGDSGVGKSNILLQFADGVFSESHITTIGVDFRIQTVKVGSSVVKLQVWDTAGQERFRSITRSYYRGVQGIMIVYDVTDAESFNHVQMWMEQAEQHADPDVQLMLIGNKSDLAANRVVHSSAGRTLADKLGIAFLETSAKDTTNVEEAFLQMARDIRTARNPAATPPMSSLSGEPVSGITIGQSNPTRRNASQAC